MQNKHREIKDQSESGQPKSNILEKPDKSVIKDLGLGNVGLAEPISVDVKNNRITVGTKQELEKSILFADNVSWINYPASLKIKAKIIPTKDKFFRNFTRSTSSGKRITSTTTSLSL